MKRHVYIIERIVDGVSTFTVEEDSHKAYTAYRNMLEVHPLPIRAKFKLHLVDISSTAIKQKVFQ